MNEKRHAVLCATLVLSCVACQPREPSGAEGATADIETAPDAIAPVDPPVAADDIAVRYRCDDGSELRISYAGAIADVTLPDGRTIALPRAESASQGGDDAYVGEALSLMVEDPNVQLHQDEGPTRNCSKL
ncbi:MliC family protein [Luteimonas salinilitoris]|uniref:C-type lysozyme inhibitor domain-containing protein n=1 Tax=Luteimonas salinilitoris TaxID=3237697 RepID=A0ABV4HYP0_9GAMM